MACGTHTTLEEPVLSHKYDYAFDFCDENGEKILPFTKKQPLLLLCSMRNEVKTVFPELESVRSCKVGMYENNTRHAVARNPRLQKFPDYWVRYDGGYVGKIPEQQSDKKKDMKQALKEELEVLLTQDSDRLWRIKVNNRLEALETERKNAFHARSGGGWY
jgi:hypothetical protein